MMVVGCILYFYMLLNGRRYVDKMIPSSFLIHMLHFGGALAPTEKGAQRFSSKVIPIHFLSTAQISVTAIINARIPIVLVPPRATIADGTTSEHYRSYYQTALGASLGIDNTLREQALAAYNHRATPISAFRTDPCLFPRYASYSVEDYSLGNGECYPSHEGRRMVQKAQESLTAAQWAIKAPACIAEKWNSFTISTDATDYIDAERSRTSTPASTSSWTQAINISWQQNRAVPAKNCQSQRA
jgi:hypothetical protein